MYETPCEIGLGANSSVPLFKQLVATRKVVSIEGTFFYGAHDLVLLVVSLDHVYKFHWFVELLTATHKRILQLLSKINLCTPEAAGVL